GEERDDEHGGEMYQGRADEGLHRRPVFLGEDAGAERGGDEQEPDQLRRVRSEQKVKVVPIVDELCERGIHAHPHGRKQVRGYYVPTIAIIHLICSLTTGSFLLEFRRQTDLLP